MRKRIARIVDGNRVGTRELHLFPAAEWYLFNAHREARRAHERPPTGVERNLILRNLAGLPEHARRRAEEELLLGDQPEARIQTSCFLAVVYSTLALEASANEAAFEELSESELAAWMTGAGPFKKPKGRSAPPWRWCSLLARLQGTAAAYDPLLEAAELLFFARNDLVHYEMEKNAAVEVRFLPPGMDAIPLIWPPGYAIEEELPATLERVIRPCFAAMSYQTARTLLARANGLLRTPFRLPPVT